VQRTAQHGRFYDSDDDEGDQRGDRDEKQPRLGPARVVETEDVPEPHRAGSPDSVGVVSEPIRQYITVEDPWDSVLYIRSESRNYCGVVPERYLSKRLPTRKPDDVEPNAAGCERGGRRLTLRKRRIARERHRNAVLTIEGGKV